MDAQKLQSPEKVNGNDKVGQKCPSQLFVIEEKRLQHTASKLSPDVYVAIASAVASIGGILFGYDIGIISGALLLLKKQFNLSDFEQEMVVCAVLIGSLCCSFFGGIIVDSFGRKKTIIVSGFLFLVAALVLALSSNYPMLIIGRFIVGLAVSMSVTAECTYISEISPPNRRGMLVSLNEVGITAGFLIAYLLNYIFISSPQGWKYMFAFAIIPALLQIVGIAFMPYSPHYLVMKGKKEEAIHALMRLRPTANVEAEIRAIEEALENTKGRKYSDLLSSTDNLRGRLLLGMTLVFFQQVSGHANVLYYAPMVFQRFGYCSDSSSTLVTVGLGIVKVISTTVTVLTVDKLGRTKLLMTGCSLMSVSVVVLGITAILTTNTNICSEQIVPANLFKEELVKNQYNMSLFYNTSNGDDILKNTYKILDAYNASHLQKSDNSSNTSTAAHRDISISTLANKIISVISLMVFVCSYGFSYGPVTWLILSEIFPTGLRGRAMSVATCINWGTNILISLTFLNLMNSIGIGYTFIMYGCISIIALIFVILCIPETKNKSLEQINNEMNNGFIKVESLKHVLAYSQCCSR